MTALDVRFKAQGPVLAKYVKSKKFVQVIRGPLGSAKTTTSCYKLLSLICSQRPDKAGVRHSQWLVTRNTYPDLLSTTIRDWRQVATDGLGQFVFTTPPEHRLDFDLPDGTKVKANVMFVALDRDEHVKKLRGVQVTGAWMNEMKEQPKSIFDMLLARVDRYKGIGYASWAGVLGDTNAWDDDHWLERLHEEWMLGQLTDYDFFIQPPGVIKVNGEWVVNENCEGVPALREAYYKRQLAGKKEDWIRVNLANETGLSFDGKPVHADYSESMHGAKAPLLARPGTVYVGIDFGLTPAAAYFQRQPSGQWYGLDEIVIENGDAELLASELKIKAALLTAEAEGDITFVYRGDPSGDIRSQANSATPFKVLQANGIPAMPATTNDPEIRRRALTRPLTRLVNGEPGILLSPRQKRLRKALAGGFHYARERVAGKEGMFKHEAVKNMHSHIAEAAEYGLMDAGEHGITNAQGRPAIRHNAPVRVPMTWTPYD